MDAQKFLDDYASGRNLSDEFYAKKLRDHAAVAFRAAAKEYDQHPSARHWRALEKAMATHQHATLNMPTKDAAALWRRFPGTYGIAGIIAMLDAVHEEHAGKMASLQV